MKKLFLIVITVVSFVSCTSDDNGVPAPLVVFRGDIVLRSQADVDAIGAQGYNVIDGFLSIGDRWTDDHTPVPSDITNLSPLSSILRVTHQIEVQSNPMLTSLSGLENIEIVAGLVLSNNDNLSSLDGLQGIKVISGSNFFSGQVLLNDGVISLFNNPSLTSITALSNIRPQTLSSINITNTGVTTLEGLENITSIESLGITNNDSLTSLEALQGLTSISDLVFIIRNDNLTNYCALQTPLQNTVDLSVFNVFDNQFNPTQQSIINGNCSQ